SGDRALKPLLASSVAYGQAVSEGQGSSVAAFMGRSARNLEAYNRRGQHIGVIDPRTGRTTGRAVPGRRVEPEMKAIHRLVGYDRGTDQMKVRYEIPSDTLAEAKRIAGVASDDPGATWSYPLSADQARAIATLIRAPIDPDDLEFFLEPFADLGAESDAGGAVLFLPVRNDRR